MILKQPKNDGDSCLLLFPKFYISLEELTKVLNDDDYLKIKMLQFKNENVDKKPFKLFKDMFDSFSEIEDMSGYIYTYRASQENRKSYQHVLTDIQYELVKAPKTSNLVLRIANEFSEYSQAIHNTKYTVSDLLFIQYTKNKVVLTFKYLNIKNLLYEIVPIYEYFIRPIYKNTVDIEIYTSMVKNISELESILNNIEELFYE